MALIKMVNSYKLNPSHKEANLNKKRNEIMFRLSTAYNHRIDAYHKKKHWTGQFQQARREEEKALKELAEFHERLHENV